MSDSKKYEKSCGAVVFTLSDKEIKYLVVQSKNGIWGFPKGHVEVGESEQETALREIKEETGLDVNIVDGFYTRDEYPIVVEGQPTIIKEVIYFLGKYEEQDCVAQETEIAQIQLLTFDEALSLFQFESTKRILAEANHFLNGGVLSLAHEMTDLQQIDDVNVIWHGHSCFEIQGAEGTLIIDPYTGVPGYEELQLKADQVIASHDHADHNHFEAVELSGRIVDFDIECIDTFHDPHGGQDRGPNKVFILTMGSYKIVHLGDLGTSLSEEEMAKLEKVDVLMTPVGGTYTIDGKEAATMMDQLRPRLIIPMHYHNKEKGLDYENITDVDVFLNALADLGHHNIVELGREASLNKLLVQENPSGMAILMMDSTR